MLTLAEFLYSLYKRDGKYSVHGTFGNLMRNIVTRILLRFLEPLPLAFAVFAVIGIGASGDRSVNPLSIFLSILLIDFTYYFIHSAHHRIPFLWMLHFVHHSDNKFNLSTSMRVNWTQELYFTMVLILPALLAGFTPVTLSAALFIFALY
ncbi:MAG TPA: sterol desaturase family protein, partial [Candidatus Absconditabacterales bacterium]|nr:sterol desaturase family protein [Candidatus Absconditabacterales bacterium]